jgi:hypothetical protein
MDKSVPPARIRPADRFPMSPPMTSNTRLTPPTSSYQRRTEQQQGELPRELLRKQPGRGERAISRKPIR